MELEAHKSKAEDKEKDIHDPAIDDLVAPPMKDTPLFAITMNGNTLPTTDLDISTSTSTSTAPNGPQSNYILIQSRKLLTPQQRQDLSNLGLTLHGYVSKNTYLYYRKGVNLEKIRELESVVYFGIYEEHFKIADSLRKTTCNLDDSTSRISHDVVAVFHRNVDPSTEEIKAFVSNKAHVGIKRIQIGRNTLWFTVQECYIRDVASIDEMRYMQEVTKPTLCNERA